MGSPAAEPAAAPPKKRMSSGASTKDAAALAKSSNGAAPKAAAKPASSGSLPVAVRMPPPMAAPASDAAAAPAPASDPLLVAVSPNAFEAGEPSWLARKSPSEGPTWWSDLRKAALQLVSWPGFDLFILAVIIASCVIMATQSPIEKAANAGTPKAALYAALEEVFTYIFTAEVATKLLAYGWGLYLADGWNVFDFFVVSTAWLQRLPGVGNYTALRAVRVLRALRMVNRVPSLKRVINSLLDSLPELSNVATLFAMFVFLMSIVGVNLFEGKMHYRCTLPGADAPVGDHELCVADTDCDAPATCVYWPTGPDFGAVSYDNVGAAFATIFQAVTLEGWVDQMYMLRRTAGGPAAVLFYLVLVIVGSNFIVNLFLAVLFDSFTSSQERTGGRRGRRRGAPTPRRSAPSSASAGA